MRQLSAPVIGLIVSLGCSGGGPSDARRAEPALPSSGSAAQRTSARPLAPLEAPSVAASILTNRELFLGGADVSSACEPWVVEVPDMLDETHAKLRRSGAEGEVRVTVDLERRGVELLLGPPCYGVKRGEICMACPEGSVEVRAYARRDDCEEGAVARSAPLSGCVAAVGGPALARARQTLDGSLRDALVRQIEGSRVVSQGVGADCQEYVVRKAGKRLLLDWAFSEYPEEVTRLEGGVLAIDEVPEKNPHHRPRGGLSAIGIGCCDGRRYHVLDVARDHAVLRTIPYPGEKNGPRVIELRLSGCPSS